MRVTLQDGLKLPDILKASAAQAFALAFACAAFIYLAKSRIIPTPEPWMFLLATFVGIFAGSLWVVLAMRGLWKWLALGTRWQRRQHARARRKAVADYIPHMNEEERLIIGYLLERNQKSFECAADGGNAKTLLARGIVRSALRPGQFFDLEDVPMIIPDDVWEVLSAHREEFPAHYRGDAHPWRVHWMAR